MKLNLGSGPRSSHLPGWVNVDILADADVQFDLGRDVWPWSEGSIDELRADNLLEHFNNQQFLLVMNQAHRVLRTDGRFWFRVPDAELWPDGAFGDPMHCRFFFPRSFLYLDHSKEQWKNYGRHYGFKPWNIKVERVKTSAVGRFFDATCRPVK